MALGIFWVSTLRVPRKFYWLWEVPVFCMQQGFDPLCTAVSASATTSFDVIKWIHFSAA